MSSSKCRKEDCNKSFANASNRLRHEKKSGHLPQKKKTFIVSEFTVQNLINQKVSVFALHEGIIIHKQCFFIKSI